MVIFWAALAVVLVFVIAAVLIGREAHRLSDEPPRPVFDLDEAVEWVARHLPNEVTAELSYDDVRQILRWNLEFFRSKGVTRNGKSPDEPATDVVVAGGETVDHVLRRAAETGADYTAPQVHAVLDAQMAYLQVIGALGPAKPDEQSPG
jgi:hypothetical protein